MTPHTSPASVPECPAPLIYELTDQQVAEVLRFTRGRVLLRPLPQYYRQTHGVTDGNGNRFTVSALDLYEAEYAMTYLWSIAALLGPANSNRANNAAAAVAAEATLERVNSLFQVFRRNLRAAFIAGRCEIVRGTFGDWRALRQLIDAFALYASAVENTRHVEVRSKL